MKNLKNDFRLFALDNKVSGSVFDDITKRAENTYTRTILEERQMNVASMDIYSRLLYDRVMYFGEEFGAETCNLAVAQLLYLSSIGGEGISIYINSPGGSVMDGLAIIDTMNFIKNKVSTICVGEAASMGAVLLSCGTKGLRYVLPHARVMIHQVSGGARGTVSDMRIDLEVAERCRKDVYTLLAKNMGKTFEEVETLCDRNNWFVGQEAVELGIVDKVLEQQEE
jgi:ATP-dependent Clp protease protease subunit